MGGGGPGGSVFGDDTGPLPPARRVARRPGGMAARLRARRRDRRPRGLPPPARRPAHGLADRRRRRLRRHRGRLQPRLGDLPPLLRLAPRALHRRPAGAGFAELRTSSRLAKLLAAPALAAGLLAQLAVLDALPGQFETAAPLIAAAVALPRSPPRRGRADPPRRARGRPRRAAVAPATWSCRRSATPRADVPRRWPGDRVDRGGAGGGMFGGTSGLDAASRTRRSTAAAPSPSRASPAPRRPSSPGTVTSSRSAVLRPRERGHRDWLAGAVRDGEIRYVLPRTTPAARARR